VERWRKLPCHTFLLIEWLSFVIRFTQPPADLWDWFEAYLSDPEVSGVW